jgi:hypothetical protein
MRHLVLLLACSALLAATAAAQTSAAPAPAPTPEKVLKIYRYYFSEGRSGWNCSDCHDGNYMEVSLKYIYAHAPGHDKYTAGLLLKNVTKKTIKAVNVDFVFRETATDRDFLTYHYRAERKVGPGQKKRVWHYFRKGTEPDNFTPAAPPEALIERALTCPGGSPYFDPKLSRVPNIEENKNIERVAPCYYLPVVTRIDYADGTFWEPQTRTEEEGKR